MNKRPSTVMRIDSSHGAQGRHAQHRHVATSSNATSENATVQARPNAKASQPTHLPGSFFILVARAFPRPGQIFRDDAHRGLNGRERGKLEG
ncbi:hypothetical protein ACU4GD_01600 [Cupriavidus basilensis]